MMIPQQHRASGSPRSGFTLLELILAVSLTSILMAAIYGAMSAYWNLAMDSHEEIEQTRIAHALLKRLARDIQSCTFAEQTTQSADDDSYSPGPGTGAGIGFDPTSESLPDLDSEGSNTEATTSPGKNGLIGTSQDLILYTSDPDRNLDYVAAPDAVGTTSRNSDLMIVRWILASSGGGALGSALYTKHNDSTSDSVAGLARGSGGVSGFGQAVDTGNLALQLESTSLLAPEVKNIQFQYFDGVQWEDEWDSSTLNRMPQAVRIELTLRPAPSADDTTSDEEDTVYRLVAPVPVAAPYVEETAL